MAVKNTINLKTYPVLSLLFPHTCASCQSDLLERDSEVCGPCLLDLPETGFTGLPDNPVEKLFWGRLPLRSASSLYYFNKGGAIQKLLHEIKYKGNRALAIQLGKNLGKAIAQYHAPGSVDALIPLPLFPKKERQRGYNQAQLISEGISLVTGLPVLTDVIIRPEHTETQTKKGRLERWKNIDGKFELKDPDAIKGKTLMLVDDVVTTGATLDSCGQELFKAGNINLHIAVLCMAGS